MSKVLTLLSNDTKILSEQVKSISANPEINTIKTVGVISADQLKAISNQGNLPYIKTIILVNYLLSDKEVNSEGDNQVNNKGIEALAGLRNLPNLTELSIKLGASDKDLDLHRLNTQNVECIKNSQIFQNLRKLNINCKQGEAVEIVKKIFEYLPDLQHLTIYSDYYRDLKQEELLADYCRQNNKLDFVIVNNSFYNILKELYKQNKNNSLNIEDAKGLIFDLVQFSIEEKDIPNLEQDISNMYIKHIINNPQKYPFPINAVDTHGISLWYYYENNHEMQEFLFQHGAVPERDKRLAKIAGNPQSAHESVVETKNRFYAQKLVEMITLDYNQSKNIISNLCNDIDNLYNALINQNQIALLKLTDQTQRELLKYVPTQAEYLTGPNFQKMLDKIDDKFPEQALNDLNFQQMLTKQAQVPNDPNFQQQLARLDKNKAKERQEILKKEISKEQYLESQEKFIKHMLNQVKKTIESSQFISQSLKLQPSQNRDNTILDKIPEDHIDTLSKDKEDTLSKDKALPHSL